MLQDKEHTDVAFPGAAKPRGAAGDLPLSTGPRRIPFRRPSVKAVQYRERSDGMGIISCNISADSMRRHYD